MRSLSSLTKLFSKALSIAKMTPNDNKVKERKRMTLSLKRNDVRRTYNSGLSRYPRPRNVSIGLSSPEGSIFLRKRLINTSSTLLSLS